MTPPCQLGLAAAFPPPWAAHDRTATAPGGPVTPYRSADELLTENTTAQLQ